MNLILLTHEYPYPANYGGHVYTSKVIENIIDYGHRLAVICAEPQGTLAPERYHKHFRFFERRKGAPWRYLTNGLPYMALRYHTAEVTARLEQAITETSGRVDAIFVDYLALGWICGDIHRIFQRLGRPVPELIYVSHNVETDVRRLVAAGYRGNALIRLFLHFDAWRTRRLESSMLAQCNLVTTITQDDAERFAQLALPAASYVLSPGYKGEFAPHHYLPKDLPRAAALIGNRLTVMKKIVLDTFLKHNYAPVSANDISVHVAGPMSESDLARYRSAYPRFQFHGYIGDLPPMLRQVRIGIVADNIGGGFKHRFLTYVFQRVPIIAPRSALAGLPLIEGEDFIAFDEPAEIADLLARHIDDQDELDRLQRSAFARCAERFSYANNVGAFLDWYEGRQAAA